MKDIIDREYKFEDKDETRDFFTRLTGLYKNYNYSAPDSKEYKDYIKQIEDLVAKHTRVA